MNEGLGKHKKVKYFTLGAFMDINEAINELLEKASLKL